MSAPRGGGTHQQIGHTPLALLIAAQAAVLAPHVSRISVWVTLVALTAAFWRIGIYRGLLSHPPNWLKLSLVVAGGVAVLGSAQSAFSVDPAVDLLIIACALKLIEMANRRDAFVVVLVAWFVAAAVFLFRQDILTTAYVVFAATVVAAALVGLSQSPGRHHPLRTFGLAAKMMLQAVPLALLVFVFFPRIAPLWSVPSPGGAATGIGEVIEPGAIARLSNSSDLAFRVAFDGDVPTRRELYWRGLVYSNFSEGRWSAAEMPENADFYALGGGRYARWRGAARGERRIVYDVVMEPTGRNWLFALDRPVLGSERTILLRDWRLASLAEVRAKFSYRAESIADAEIDVASPGWFAAVDLALPEGESPRARALAARLRAEASDDADYVRRVLAIYRERPFVYTLSPGTLPRRDSIDAFLFDSERGFCSHFAGSFVFLMRAGGLPARMIGGYQGGEWNATGGFLAVRQYDAHAWAEVWLSGQGWVRVDPTALVAPERIESGLEAALASRRELASSPFAGLALRDFGGLAALVEWFESLEYQWNVWVLGYDGTVQLATLERWFGQMSLLRLALVFAAMVVVVLVALTLVIAWRSLLERRSFEVRSFARLAALLGAGGSNGAGSPAQLAARVARDDPRLARLAVPALEDLEALLYDPGAPRALLRARVRRTMGRLWLATLLGRGEGRA